MRPVHMFFGGVNENKHRNSGIYRNSEYDSGLGLCTEKTVKVHFCRRKTGTTYRKMQTVECAASDSCHSLLSIARSISTVAHHYGGVLVQ
jgi:hypothetical protein